MTATRPVGRPPVTFARLVRERRFDWQRKRHRRALLDADAGELEPDLAWQVRAYRGYAEMDDRSNAVGMARQIADAARRR